MHGLLLKFPGIFSLLLASVSRERASSSPTRVGVSVVGNFAARFFLVARFNQLIASSSRASFCPGGFLVGPNFRLPLRPTGSGSAVLALAGGSNLEQRAGQYGALCCSSLGLLGCSYFKASSLSTASAAVLERCMYSSARLQYSTVLAYSCTKVQEY